MNLDFCCGLQMVGSELGGNSMNPWPKPALYKQSRQVDVVKQEIRSINVQLANLPQLCDVNKEGPEFQRHDVESMVQTTKADQRVKAGIHPVMTWCSH